MDRRSLRIPIEPTWKNGRIVAFITGTLLVPFFALGLFAGTAQAATDTNGAKIPASVTAGGETLVEHHQEVVGGTTLDVYVTKGSHSQIVRPSALAARSSALAQPATTYVYSDWGQVSYYLGSSLAFWMKDSVTWTGDGRYTVTTATPSHNTTHGVTTLGSALLQVVWKGVVSHGDSRIASSSGAYWDSYREGRFQQCILGKGCTSNEWYPYIHEYLYGGGGDILRSYQ